MPAPRPPGTSADPPRGSGRLGAARRSALFAFAPLALAGCVVVPRTVAGVDPVCRVQVRHMTLDVAQIAAFRGCSNEGCLVLLTVSGVVTVASAVVSGSIALVGNAVYWAERQGAGCPGIDGAP